MKQRFDKYDLAYFAIIAIAFYFLIRQYIPCVEDFHYIFSKATGEPIQSLKDVLLSQAHDYMHLNGRFLTHSLVQWFCSITGPIPFYLISALSFGLLVMGMTSLTRYLTQQKQPIDKYLLTVCLMLFIPEVGRTYLGHISFVVNYLWGSAIYVWFLVGYFHLKDNKTEYKLWQTMLLCLAAFSAGTWQESFSLGIAGALFLYHIFHLKQTKGTLLYFLLSFALGVVVCGFAPGNFERFMMGSAAEHRFVLSEWISAHLYQIKMLLKHCPPIAIFAALCLLVPMCLRKQTWAFVKTNYMLLLPCLLMALFGIFIAFSGEHQFVVVGLFSSIVLVNLLVTILPDNKLLQMVVSAVAICFMLAMYVPIFHYRAELVKANQQFETSIVNSTDSTALSTDIERFVRMDMKDSFFSRYINIDFVQYSYSTVYFCQLYSSYLYPDHQIHVNVALPEKKEQIIALCTEENMLSMYVYDSPDLEYFIVKIPAEYDAKNVAITCGDISVSTIDKLKDKIMHRVGQEKVSTYTLEPTGFSDYYRYFIEDGMRYVICTKPTARKLSSVSVEL